MKLSELEIEKIQNIQKEQQSLQQLNAIIGELVTSLEIYKPQAIQKQMEFNKISQELQESLEAKYGKGFQIQEDGTVITQTETIDSKDISE